MGTAIVRVGDVDPRVIVEFEDGRRGIVREHLPPGRGLLGYAENTTLIGGTPETRLEAPNRGTATVDSDTPCRIVFDPIAASRIALNENPRGKPWFEQGVE